MRGPLTTERLLLRPFREDDLPALHAIWSDPEVGPWVGGTHTSLIESVQELGEHLRHQQRFGFGFWAVEERGSGRVVGEVGLMRFENRGPEIETGWCIARDRWGLGYARESAARWLQAGFSDLGLDRIIAVVLPENARSRRVCAALGMTEQGTRHAYGSEHVLYDVQSQEFSRG